MNIEKLMASIQKAKPGKYDCSFSALVAIRDASGGGALETGANCFNFGFLQGQKAAKAATRATGMKKMEGDAPGYGRLSALVEMHRKDADFTRTMMSIAWSKHTREQRQKGEVSHD